MKDLFIKTIARIQNYRDKLDTKNRLLTKAFGSDSQVMDLYGEEELIDTSVDLFSLIFDRLSRDEIEENVSWYLYEVPMLDDPKVEDGDKKWVINNSEDLYNMLEEFNNNKLLTVEEVIK